MKFQFSSSQAQSALEVGSLRSELEKLMSLKSTLESRINEALNDKNMALENIENLNKTSKIFHLKLLFIF